MEHTEFLTIMRVYAVFLVCHQFSCLLRAQTGLDGSFRIETIRIVKGALLFGSVVEAGVSHIKITAFTDPTSSFVVSQEGAQTMVSRVAVLQAVQVGDVKSKSSRTKFSSL